MSFAYASNAVSARKHPETESIAVGVATAADRDEIYRVRHEVYARELRQHPANVSGSLRDSLDCSNIYLVARIFGKIAGFVSITPPEAPAYSIDKYFAREALPFPVHKRLYEIRLLTVLKKYRGSDAATLLMYAAFRWVEARGGSHIVAIGRREILDLYLKVGLQPTGMRACPGSVTYDLVHAATNEVRAALSPFHGTLARLRKNHYDVDLDRLRNSFRDGYDIVVLVNPNSPTGRHIPRAALEDVLQDAPGRTRVWIDETYVDYAGPAESLEGFAARTENIIVCKSMSKVYALSGARVAYLCAGAHQLESLRAITPPWVVSLPGQVAAVNALRDPEYYAALHAKTAALREKLGEALEAQGWNVVPGSANFLLCHLPESGPTSAELVHACRRHGLFLRDASLMGSNLGQHAVRVAVKDATTNARMLAILADCQPTPMRTLV